MRTCIFGAHQGKKDTRPVGYGRRHVVTVGRACRDGCLGDINRERGCDAGLLHNVLGKRGAVMAKGWKR